MKDEKRHPLHWIVEYGEKLKEGFWWTAKSFSPTSCNYAFGGLCCHVGLASLMLWSQKLPLEVSRKLNLIEMYMLMLWGQRAGRWYVCLPQCEGRQRNSKRRHQLVLERLHQFHWCNSWHQFPGLCLCLCLRRMLALQKCNNRISAIIGHLIAPLLIYPSTFLVGSLQMLEGWSCCLTRCIWISLRDLKAQEKWERKGVSLRMRKREKEFLYQREGEKRSFFTNEKERKGVSL